MGPKLYISLILAILSASLYYKVLNKGPRHSWGCRLIDYQCDVNDNISLSKNSRYNPKFEKVIQEFKDNFSKGKEIGASLSVYIKSKSEIDISAGIRNLTAFNLTKLILYNFCF